MNTDIHTMIVGLRDAFGDAARRGNLGDCENLMAIAITAGMNQCLLVGKAVDIARDLGHVRVQEYLSSHYENYVMYLSIGIGCMR